MRSVAVIFLLFCLGTSRAAVCFTTGSGLWNNAATWSCGHVPTCGDSAVILSGHTVTINNSDLTGCSTRFTLTIKGSLKFNAVGKLTLSCQGVVYVHTGGSVTPHAGTTGNQNAIMTCGSTWWNSTAGIYNGPGCMPATLPGCAAALPVYLTHFTAKHCGSSVCVSWQITDKKDLGDFELQRSSDGENYMTISRFKDPGKNLLFEYEDPVQLKGTAYYRLVHTEDDNSVQYFGPLAVSNNNGQRRTSLHPNPSNGSVVIEPGNLMDNGTQLDISVMDATGRVQISQSYPARSRSITLELPLRPGVYFCLLRCGSVTETFKLIRQ